MEQEIHHLMIISKKYNIIAFDTEFPGIAIQNKYTEDINDYDLIKDNVN